MHIRGNLNRSLIAGVLVLLWAVMLAGLTHPAAYAAPQSSSAYAASSQHYVSPTLATSQASAPTYTNVSYYHHHRSHRTAKYTVGGAAGGALIGGLAGGGKGALIGGALGAGGGYGLSKLTHRHH